MSETADHVSDEVTIATLRRSDREELRVVLCSYKGHPYVGIRVWAVCSDDVLRPVGRKGVTVRVPELSEVIDALARCEAILDGGEGDHGQA